MGEVLTIRLPDDLYQAVRLEAYLREVPVSAVIREAIDEYIDRKRADPEWQCKAREYLARNQAVFDRLMTAPVLAQEHTEPQEQT